MLSVSNKFSWCLTDQHSLCTVVSVYGLECGCTDCGEDHGKDNDQGQEEMSGVSKGVQGEPE